jgi:Flp pilus assembly protein TadG
MKRLMRLICDRIIQDQSGQALVMMLTMMLALLGFTGFVVDVGDVYYSYQMLQASTNAAAIAGATGLPTSGTLALSYAQAYNSQSGNKNQFANLNITNYTATLGCVNGAVASNVPCVNTGLSTGAATANAIQIKQTARVKTFFMAVLGTPYVDLTATGTALMQGGTGTPYNIAVVLDVTESMTTQDQNCGSYQVPVTTTKHGKTTTTYETEYYSRLGCAENGVQQFLAGIHPCASSGCGSAVSGSSYDYTNAVDKVALFTFPEPANSTTAEDDYNCTGSNPQIIPYTFPSATATSYTYSSSGSGGDYQITPYMGNYQTVSNGDATGTLNTSSSAYLPLAVGASSSCPAMGAPGGEGTYYAGAIYAAQASLTAAQAAEAQNGLQVQNAMIIVSDGDASASKSQMASSATSNGLYPSYNDECQQAITAAQAATAAGTTVYTVAYGSPNSGCSTDGSRLSPCQTMQEMASNAGTFYSDNNQSGTSSSCYSENAPADLADIFTALVGRFTNTRLIPNATFPSS